jgi:hypothetical protein
MSQLRLIPAKIVTKLWGYEKHLVNTELYCGKILVALPNGMACSIHYHKRKTETFHVLKGRLFLQLFSLGLLSPARHPDEVPAQWEGNSC